MLAVGIVGLMVGAGSAVASHQQQSKARKEAEKRAAADLRRQEQIAAAAREETPEGEVELVDEEDELLTGRTRRDRLRVGRDTGVATPGAVGTGLSVG